MIKKIRRQIWIILQTFSHSQNSLENGRNTQTSCERYDQISGDGGGGGVRWVGGEVGKSGGVGNFDKIRKKGLFGSKIKF